MNTIWKRKPPLGWVVLLLIFAVVWLIRTKIYPPKPYPPPVNILEEQIKHSTPECARLLREDLSRSDRESAAEDSENDAYLREWFRIEHSNLPETEKEIKWLRLSEKYDIEATVQKTDSDIAFRRFLYDMKAAGCFKK